MANSKRSWQGYYVDTFINKFTVKEKVKLLNKLLKWLRSIKTFLS